MFLTHHDRGAGTEQGDDDVVSLLTLDAGIGIVERAEDDELGAVEIGGDPDPIRGQSDLEALDRFFLGAELGLTRRACDNSREDGKNRCGSQVPTARPFAEPACASSAPPAHCRAPEGAASVKISLGGMTSSTPRRMPTARTRRARRARS